MLRGLLTRFSDEADAVKRPTEISSMGSGLRKSWRKMMIRWVVAFGACPHPQTARP